MGPAPSPPGEPRLPSLPTVVARLVSFYASEDHRVEKVVELVETDPPLSGRLLRLANSAYYGFSGRVDTLRRSVVLLGGATVQAIALGSTLLGRWGSSAPPREVEALWVHSYLCALGCRYVGNRLPVDARGSAQPEALFLAGLLHDVGKILFLGREPSRYPQELGESPASEDLRSRERELFGSDHAEAGGELLAAWNLPIRIVALVRHHHGGELRAELHRDREVLGAVNGILAGRPAPEQLPTALVGDLSHHLEQSKAQAEDFYHAIS